MSSSVYASLIEKFYTAFAARNPDGMRACYHPDVTFSDPAFGVLQGADAGFMWEMLLRRPSDLHVSFTNVTASGSTGAAEWTATYTFSATGRKVVNKIKASFEFRDHKIYVHRDVFDLSAWFLQAFGWRGYLFVTLPFLRRAFQKKVRATLAQYKAKYAGYSGV